MKIKIYAGSFTLLLALFVAGCMTPRIDWNARIGHYTFDQAVIELGPPDKQARLSDGRTVAEWVSRSQTGGMSYSTMTYGGGYNGYPGGVGIVHTTPPMYFERKWRLTFSPDNVLTAWSRN